MSEALRSVGPPAGYAPLERRGAFWRMSGPYFERESVGRIEHAFLVREDNCNALGFLHGAMMSAFVDGLFARAARGRRDAPTAVTVHLSIDFLGMARVGEWVEGEAQITHAGRALVFVEGRAHVGGRDVVRASGVFRPPQKS
jgi:acyl-coenzyme A thioesterase PaaI-like protein